MVYRVFVRTWWRENPLWPKGLEPHIGPKKTIALAAGETEARFICRSWNARHDPGRLSMKAEYEEFAL